MMEEKKEKIKIPHLLLYYQNMLKNNLDLGKREENLKIYKQLIFQTEEKIENLHFFLLDPILNIYNQQDKNKRKEKEECAEIIKLLLDKDYKLNYFLFSTILDASLTNLSEQIEDEDYVEKIMNALKSIIKCTDLKEDFWKQGAARAAVGYSLSKALDISLLYKKRNVKLICLEYLVECCRKMDKHVLAAFFPGTISKISKLVMGDFKQGSNVTNCALSSLCQIICLLMDDESNQNFFKQDFTDFQKMKEHFQKTQGKSQNTPKDENKIGVSIEQNDLIKETIPNKNETPFWIEMDENWFNSVQRRTNEVVKICFTYLHKTYFENHPTWNVHLSCVENASLLYQNCSLSLKKCLPMFVSLLSLHSQNEYKEVSNKSQQFLEIFSKNQNFFKIISENFKKVIEKIPRIIQKSTESEKISHLCEMKGYINIFSEMGKINSTINTFIAQIENTLTSVLQFDLSDRSISFQRVDRENMKSITINDNQVSRFDNYNKRNFLFFSSGRIYSLVVSICRDLGEKSGEYASFLVEHFLSLLSSPFTSKTKSWVFILNEIVNGFEKNEKIKDSLSIVLKEILENYVEKKDLNFGENVEENKIEKDENVSLKQLFTICKQGDISEYNENEENEDSQHPSKKKRKNKSENEEIMINSLLLEGIGNVSKVLGKNFEQFLIFTLYPVLEKLGSESKKKKKNFYSFFIDFFFFSE